ncbi:MAG TPA: serine hydrolase [Actinopolymorphaceae bacterium]
MPATSESMGRDMASYEDRLADLVTAAKESETTQLHVLHDGRELTSLDGNGEALNTASVTKLLVNITVGRAVRLGLLALDDPVHRWFPEWSNGPRARITIRHVMGHVSGLAADTWPQLDVSPPPDLVAYVLHELPLVKEPGRFWAYNNAAVMVLPAVVSRAAGMPYLEFARREMFEPLGIDHWTWRCDEAGNPLAMATAAVNAASLAKCGQLLAQDGWWEGNQLLDPDWVSVCRRPPIEAVRGAGLLMFEGWSDDRAVGDPIAFGHDGSGGQHLWIFPTSRLVIARLRDNRLPDNRGYDLGTPAQQFRDLVRLGAALEEALLRTTDSE